MSLKLVLFAFMSLYMVHSASINVYSNFKEDGNPFSSLLYDIVRVNQNRVNTLKKNMEIQDYIASRGRLITGDDDEKYESIEDEPYISEHKYGIRRFDTKGTNVRVLEDLRRNWMKPCNRKAARVCRTACINSAKVVCSEYSCSRGVRRKFRKECGRNCNKEFKVTKYYSDVDS